MTATDAERFGFLGAIAAQPEDDTPRLVYADWLDERGSRQVTCPMCEGGFAPAGWSECFRCSGSGTVADRGEADRAAFIRWQVAGDHVAEFCLKNHPEWRAAPCPGCGGEGDRRPTGQHCMTCGGSGDLFTEPNWSEWNRNERVAREPKPRPVTFRRGFVDAVGCSFAELGGERQCHDCRGRGYQRRTDIPGVYNDEHTMTCPACSGSRRRFAPSPWAAAVVRAHPVLRFVDATRVPADRAVINGGFYWFKNDLIRTEYGIETDVSRALIEPHLFEAMAGENKYVIGLPFATPEAATDALALTAGRLVRKAVYGE